MKKIDLMKNKKYVTYVWKLFVWVNMIKVIKKTKKVKDHCHYTGKFRGASHSHCNLKYKFLNNIPIVIHNAIYDTDFIINQLAKEFKCEIVCIEENMEKNYYFFFTN